MISSKLFLIRLILVVLFASPVAFASNQCIALFEANQISQQQQKALTEISSKPYHKGQLINDELLYDRLGVERSSQIHLLGKGHYGQVYRIFPKKGAPYIVKEFKGLVEKSEYIHQKEAQSDFEQMKSLHAVVTAAENKNINNFKVQKVISAEKSVIKSEDARGIVLEDLIGNNSSVSDSTKKILLELYKARLENLRTSYKNSGFQVEEYYMHGSSDIIIYEQDGMFLFSFILHTGNILVDLKTLDMTIIDPN